MVTCECTVRGTPCERVILTQAVATMLALWMRSACENNLDHTTKVVMISDRRGRHDVGSSCDSGRIEQKEHRWSQTLPCCPSECRGML